MTRYYLYILRSEVKETYYVGYSDDPDRRLGYHNRERQGYTQRHRPWELVYTYEFKTLVEVQKAERKVKSWKSKKMIQLLIDGVIDIEDYLD